MGEPAPPWPEHVVVVDADNPMFEVLWKEDHEVLVAAVRDEGYRAGYTAGWVDAARQSSILGFPWPAQGTGCMINNQRCGLRTRHEGGLL
jgi:hypothetical protein